LRTAVTFQLDCLPVVSQAAEFLVVICVPRSVFMYNTCV